jgi:DNA (cytosine-5)-methyltransferase 1
MYNAVDLFSGCGGLSEGLNCAGFNVVAGIEINKDAVDVYRSNHRNSKTVIFQEDIRIFNTAKISKLLSAEPLHLLAGCPPCQGFSTLSCKNKKHARKDERNSLILEYLRCVEELRPLTIMLENVPGIERYSLFKHVFSRLNELHYNPRIKIVDVSKYGVPQRRKRLVMIGSLFGKINIPDGNEERVTVRECIGNLESTNITKDISHQRYAHHSEMVMKRIALIPHNGGSRSDLPNELVLNCHKKNGVGYKDVYGRLNWDTVSSTITGGCLNPSKGRFLHPEENRCITVREAALLQTFPEDYFFPENISMTSLALMIGNALPPKFCHIQGTAIKEHLDLNV